jgi:UDP-N-acetylmuramoyl-L-alanyl-D-glutamate--2,6-diaminopimelate ligase
MKLSDLVADVEDAEIIGDGSVSVSGLHYDSRRIRPGELFVALKGAVRDGAEFVAEALRQGASAVAGEDISGLGDRTAVRVRHARRAMATMARRFYGKPDEELKMVGITGTNGKSTTAFIVKHLLQQVGMRTGLLGTIRYEIGDRLLPAPHTTPESVDLYGHLRAMVDEGCEAAVMEVSSHALAQDRVHDLDFDVAIFTNLTQDHLDYHGTLDAYFEAKTKLFLELGQQSKRPHAIINAEDCYGQRLMKDQRLRAVQISYGPESSDAVLQWRLVGWRPTGARAEFVWDGQKETVTLPLFGLFNLANAAAALGAALAIRGPGQFSDLVRALGSVPAVPGRLQRVPSVRGPYVFVDYAHTDDALRKTLETVRQLPHRRILTVFGCGGNRDRAKRPLMGKVARALSDQVFVTSDNPRWEDPEEIIRDILAGIEKREEVFATIDRREAIHAAIRAAQPGDIVLIAGKGHETYQEEQGIRVPFDDAVVAAEVLEEMSCAQ